MKTQATHRAPTGHEKMKEGPNRETRSAQLVHDQPGRTDSALVSSNIRQHIRTLKEGHTDHKVSSLTQRVALAAEPAQLSSKVVIISQAA